jgi:hypothetical protein
MLKQGFRGLKNWTTCEQSFIFFPDFTRVLVNGDGVNTVYGVEKFAHTGDRALTLNDAM